MSRTWKRSDDIRRVLLHHAMLIEQENVPVISSEHDRQLIRQSYDTAIKAIGLAEAPPFSFHSTGQTI